MSIRCQEKAMTPLMCPLFVSLFALLSSHYHEYWSRQSGSYGQVLEFSYLKNALTYGIFSSFSFKRALFCVSDKQPQDITSPDLSPPNSRSIFLFAGSSPAKKYLWWIAPISKGKSMPQSKSGTALALGLSWCTKHRPHPVSLLSY